MKTKYYQDSTRYQKKQWVRYGDERWRLLDVTAWLQYGISYPGVLYIRKKKEAEECLK